MYVTNYNSPTNGGHLKVNVKYIIWGSYNGSRTDSIYHVESVYKSCSELKVNPQLILFLGVCLLFYALHYLLSGGEVMLW